MTVLLPGYTTRTGDPPASPAPVNHHAASDTPSSSRSVKHYDGLVRGGSLKEDGQQRDALHQLGQLQTLLHGYSNSLYLIPPKPKVKAKDGDAKRPRDSKSNTTQIEADAPAEEVYRLYCDIFFRCQT